MPEEMGSLQFESASFRKHVSVVSAGERPCSKFPFFQCTRLFISTVLNISSAKGTLLFMQNLYLRGYARY
jgi:hypothetical protein